MSVRAPYRFLTLLLAIVSVTLVIFAFINFQQRRIYVLPTDGVSWVTTPQGLKAWSMAANSPGKQAGIIAGDILKSIDGRSVKTTVDASREIFESGIWSRATYDLVRGGESFETSVVLAPEKNSRGLHGYLEIVGIIYLIIGAFVFLRRWSAAKSLHFYLFCLVSFVLYCFSYTGKLNLFDSSVYWLNVTALLLQPALFLHFCLTFPEAPRFIERRRYVLPALYAPAAFLLAFHVLVMAGFVNLPLPMLSIRWLLDSAEMAYLAVFSVAGVLLLFRSYRRASSPLAKQQLKWVTRGAAVAVMPFAILYAVPYFLGMGFIPAEWLKLSVFFLVLLPLTFGYAIVRYRLMDVDMIFRRGIAYALATAAIVGFYFGLVFLFADFFRNSALITTQGGWLLAIVVTALLFQPVVTRIQVRLDRFFNRERYDYRRTLLDFARDLGSEVHVDSLLDQAVERLAETLGVDRVAAFLKSETGELHLAKSRGLTFAGDLDLGFLDSPEIEKGKGYLFFESVKHPPVLLPSRRLTIERLGLHYYLPLRVKGNTLGFLALGKTEEDDFLSSEDVDLLQTVSGYIAIAVESARLYESLERKALENQALKDFSENIIESIDAGIVAWNPEQCIESWNSSMERLYGIPNAEAEGKQLTDIFPPDLISQLPRHSEPYRSLNLYKFRLRNAAGRSLIVNLSTVPLLGKDDHVIGRLLIMNDLTERVELEDQLVQAEKLSSIGMLAAGVAHEVNTPLAVITSQLQMMMRQLPCDDPHSPVLDRVVKQGFRASEIINNLLKFSRVSGSERVDLELNKIIKETLILVAPMLRTAKISVQTELDPDLPAIQGSSGKLQQVFMNLIMNARDAMPHGGELMVATSAVDSTVMVEIADNGVGISPENLRKIFDPFFTTKATNRGTGLGLAVSYGIIREHSGKIYVDSSVGRGASFRLEFPASRKPVNAL
ncbi:MAG: PAS domain S-box protein [Acidobacteria bacterium]|nr:MAG: PAS domain S-box protein [Acidobacteriota bacterium]